MRYGEKNDTTAEKVPKSCCIKPKGEELSKDDILNCQKDPGNDDYELKGCYKKLKDSVRNHKSKILGVAITILVVMVNIITIMNINYSCSEQILHIYRV